MRVAEAALQRCSYEKEGVLKICSKFTGELPCQSVISIKLQSSFFEITLRHECSPVNLLHIFRTPFPKNTFEGLLLPQIRLLIYLAEVKFNLFMTEDVII